MTIEYLSLIFSWVDSFLSLQLHHLLHSSFLIQMLRWRRVYSRVEPSYLSSLEGSSLDGKSLIFPYSFLLLWVEHLLMCALPGIFLKVITSFWHKFLAWMNPIIMGGHSRWLSPLFHSPLLLLLLQVVLFIWETLVKYDCMVSAF